MEGFVLEDVAFPGLDLLRQGVEGGHELAELLLGLGLPLEEFLLILGEGFFQGCDAFLELLLEVLVPEFLRLEFFLEIRDEVDLDFELLAHLLELQELLLEGGSSVSLGGVG